MEPLDDNNPANPRRPSGGTSLLMLLVLAIVIAALVVWAYARSDPGQPKPTATGNPKALPATGSAGASPTH
jgi:predicted transporter